MVIVQCSLPSTIIVLYFKSDMKSKPLISKAPALQLFHKHFTVVIRVTEWGSKFGRIVHWIVLSERSWFHCISRAAPQPLMLLLFHIHLHLLSLICAAPCSVFDCCFPFPQYKWLVTANPTTERGEFQCRLCCWWQRTRWLLQRDQTHRLRHQRQRCWEELNLKPEL